MIAFCADIEEKHSCLLALGLIVEEHGAMEALNDRVIKERHSPLLHLGQVIVSWA